MVLLLFCTEELNLYEMQFYFKFDDNNRKAFHYIVRNPPFINDRIFVGIL